MRPLRHTLPLGPGETPASFVSRLAALYRTSAREICLDIGTTFQKVVDGDIKALEAVAVKANVQVAALAENAFIKIAERRHTFRQEHLTRDSLRRATVVVCPRCLAEDLAATPQARSDTVAIQRVTWQIAALKTCAVHLAPLIVVDNDMTPGLLHDWAHHVGKVLPFLPQLVADAETRAPSPFETYVADRLDRGADAYLLLDTMPLFVAIAACELFGAVATLGRMPNLKKLSDEEWRLAGAAGFQIFAGGQAAVDGFLSGLRKSYPYSGAATEGPQAVLGRVYQMLEFGRDDAAYDPLRTLVGDFIRKSFPLGAGDLVFGVPVETRLLHSVRTLAIETGVHPKRLRKLLSSAGVLPENAADLADGNCLFDAQAGLAIAAEAAAATLSVRGAGIHLNAPRVQRDMLYRSGLIVPRIKASGHGAADQFAPEDLDAFLARLFEGAVTVPAAGPGKVDIPTAARLACCKSEEIVRGALDGRLTKKAHLAGERGYMALLVDVDEVRTLVRGPEHDGLTGLEVKARLGTTAKVAALLIKHGHLKTVTVVNPVNRCPTVIVPNEDVERFEREYVSLFSIARQQGRHHLLVKKDLEAASAKPAFDPKIIGATFYLCRDVARSLVCPCHAT